MTTAIIYLVSIHIISPTEYGVSSRLVGAADAQQRRTTSIIIIELIVIYHSPHSPANERNKTECLLLH